MLPARQARRGPLRVRQGCEPLLDSRPEPFAAARHAAAKLLAQPGQRAACRGVPRGVGGGGFDAAVCDERPGGHKAAGEPGGIHAGTVPNQTHSKELKAYLTFARIQRST